MVRTNMDNQYYYQRPQQDDRYNSLNNTVNAAITAGGFAIVTLAIVYAIQSVIGMVRGDEPTPPPDIQRYY